MHPSPKAPKRSLFSAVFVLLLLASGATWALGGPPRTAIASAHPLATAAGFEVLEVGGNAFDAVVAASFVACVAEPVLASLGGAGF